MSYSDVRGLAGVSARRGGGCPAMGERWDTLRHGLPAVDRRGVFLSPGVDAAEVAVLKAGDAQRAPPSTGLLNARPVTTTLSTPP